MNKTLDKIYKLFLSSKGVEIDSRKIEANKLFFAFKGDQVDGHQYVEKVIEKDNVYAIIDNSDYYVDERTILVEDTLICIQKLAHLYRKSFDIPVIGITGSNGKTTTKELLYAVLSAQFKVHATKGNFNNHLGVPLTLLACPRDTQIMIVEMGANKPGDIDELCQIADPNYGLITNIGHAHIEGFGSFEGVIQTKTEMYRYLANHNGLAFVNDADNILLNNIPSSLKTKSYLSNDIKIQDNGLNLLLHDEPDGTQYTTEMYGIYNKPNILAAYSIGTYFKVNPRLIIEALISYKPNMNRSEIVELGATTLILDAYNANPTSMIASINTLASLEDERGKILVLGDMLELGKDELSFHSEVLECIEKYQWLKIILVGQKFSQVAQKAYDSFDNLESFTNVDALISAYAQNMGAFDNAIILIKASRSIKLEKFREAFESLS